MTVTVTAVPESITHEQFVDWLASIGMDGIHATVYALDDNGRYYANAGGTEPATHVIHVRIDGT